MKIVKKNIRGYYGMNHLAGKELKIKCTPSMNTIYINKSLKGRFKRQVIAHEKIELWLMKNKHMKYKTAHNIAEKFDKNIR